MQHVYETNVAFTCWPGDGQLDDRVLEEPPDEVGAGVAWDGRDLRGHVLLDLDGRGVPSPLAAHHEV